MFSLTWNPRSQSHIDLAMSLEGQTSEQECRLLFELASQVEQGCIVEVGSYRGRSTVALAYGVIASGSLAPVYALDPHEPFQGILGRLFGPKDRCAFFRNMLNAGACEVVRLVNLSSEVVTANWPFPVSLLWLDGDHTYEGVRRDFDCWDPHVVKGGVVAFHDSMDSELGPYVVVTELLDTNRFLEIRQAGLTTVLRKLG